MKIQTVRGTRDILPGEVEAWQKIEAHARQTFARYGFREIRTPIFEATELFSRGVGTSTDIVRKEMFSFLSGNDSLTLRPEMTASVVRAFIQHGLARVPGAERLYYIGPMFRHERPQKGRQRQFHQVGVEVLGSADAYIDAETIEMVISWLEALGVSGTTLLLNSVGCPACRPEFKRALVAWLAEPVPRSGERPVDPAARASSEQGERAERGKAGEAGEAAPRVAASAPGAPRSAALCEDCGRRLVENPLRVFDCKVPADRALLEGAPTMLEHLCEACREHFGAVQTHLDTMGIAYTIDPRLVRGLDYYVRTAFEITAASGLGSQNSLMGGGRYDGLVAELGGPDLPGFGWALGLERLMMLLGAMSAESSITTLESTSDLFIAHMGDAARTAAISLAKDLRAKGLSVRLDPRPARIGAQLKRADREGARFALILGEEEMASGIYQIKDMATQTQQPIEAGSPSSRGNLLEALVRRVTSQEPSC